MGRKKVDKPYDRSTYSWVNCSGVHIQTLRGDLMDIMEDTYEVGLEVGYLRDRLKCLGYPSLPEEHIKDVLRDIDCHSEWKKVWKLTFRSLEELDAMEQRPCQM